MAIAHPDNPTEYDAPCVGATDTFYGPEADLRDEPLDEKEAREARCREVCQTCFMRLECLSFALINKEKFGVWGGMSPGDRREFRKVLKKIHKEGWKNAAANLSKLRFRSEVFLRKKEEERAKLQRQKEQEGVQRRQPTPVVVRAGKRDDPGPRSVAGGNRSGAARSGRKVGGGAQAHPDRSNRGVGKAASAKRKKNQGRGLLG